MSPGQMTQNIDMASGKTTEMFKAAGAQQALADLGLLDDGVMEKTAWAPVSWTLGKLGQGIWGLGSKLLGRAGDAVGGVGTKMLQGATKAGLPQGAGNFLGQVGKGMGRDIAGFSLLGGGIEAAIADPGQRWDAFQRGALHGAIGGAAWGAGSNLARMGMGRGLKALGSSPSGLGKGQAGLGLFKSHDPFAAATRVAEPGVWGALTQEGLTAGQRARIFGARALTGGVPLAAAYGASTLVEPSGQDVQPRPFYQQPQTYYPILAAGGRYGGPYGGYGY